MNKKWVVFVGGFSTEREVYAGEIRELEKSGREVVFFRPDDGINLSLLAEKGIWSADFIAISQGVAVLIEFALLCPEFVQRIVLVNPAGLIGEDGVKRLVARFLWQLMIEELWAMAQVLRFDFHPLKASIHASWPFLKSLTLNIRRRLFKEIPAIARLNLTPLLRELKRANASIEVVLLNAYSDRIFNEACIAKTLGLAEAPFGFFDRWAMYVRRGASHNAPYLERPGVLRQLLSELKQNSTWAGKG